MKERRVSREWFVCTPAIVMSFEIFNGLKFKFDFFVGCFVESLAKRAEVCHGDGVGVVSVVSVVRVWSVGKCVEESRFVLPG
jgi:hypothetical protein